VPFYAIKGSPVNESPLGLFNATEDGAILEETTASAALPQPIMSPGP
jgi:serine protein kinase